MDQSRPIELQERKHDHSPSPQVRFKISDEDDENQPMMNTAPEIVIDPPSYHSMNDQNSENV